MANFIKAIFKINMGKKSFIALLAYITVYTMKMLKKCSKRAYNRGLSAYIQRKTA